MYDALILCALTLWHIFTLTLPLLTAVGGVFALLWWIEKANGRDLRDTLREIRDAVFGKDVEPSTIPVDCPECGYKVALVSHPGIYDLRCICGFEGTTESGKAPASDEEE